MAVTYPFSEIVPVKPALAHEQVLNQISIAISLGRIRPGERLPRERDLAAMLKVSRATVREAIVILSSQGSVSVRRGRNGGIFVNERQPNEALERGYLLRNKDEIQEIFEYRELVESEGARLAALRRSDEHLASMETCLEQMNAASSELSTLDPSSPDSSALVATFLAADNEFHLEISRASRNRWIEKATLEVRVEMFKPIGAVFHKLEPNSNHFHGQIYSAIEAGEPDDAAALMKNHIAGTMSDIASWVKE